MTPLNTLAVELSVTAPLLAVMLVLPSATWTLEFADCVMLPTTPRLSVPFVTVTLPRLKVLLLARATLPAALVVSVTAPLKALPLLLRFSAPLATVKSAVPTTLMLVLAACVMLPAAVVVTLRLTPPTLTLPSVDRAVVAQGDVVGAGVGQAHRAVEVVAGRADVDGAVVGGEAGVAAGDVDAGVGRLGDVARRGDRRARRW